MRSLKDYLNNTQQYEGILDPNQDQIMSRMTDEAIRRHIQEYCTYDRQKHRRGECWIAADEYLEITKINKDEKGWYVETKSISSITIISYDIAKSFYEYCISHGQKIDKQRGFLIKDTDIYFRWRKHGGELSVMDAPSFESTEGLPEELDKLYLFPGHLGKQSKKLEVRNKIKIIELASVEDIKISGNGCKNIMIDPDDPCDNVTAPNGVNIYRPKDLGEYLNLINKLSKH